MTNSSPRYLRRKIRSRESIDKTTMKAEMDLILKSVNSLTRTNRSSLDKSPRRNSIDLLKKNKLVSSLRNSKKLYHDKIKEEKDYIDNESEKSLTLDLSIDQEYTMLKCKICSMYFVQKDLQNHIKQCK